MVIVYSIHLLSILFTSIIRYALASIPSSIHLLKSLLQ